MELGTGLITCQRRPDDDRSMTAIYDEMMDFASTAEAAGLESVWVSEHHFSEDQYMPGVLPAVSAIAGATEEIQVGTFVALAPLYDSIRFAEDAATASLISDGRVVTGLANGYREAEFEAFGVPLDERVARTEDLVRVLRGAWSEGPLEYDPEFHPAGPETDVTPKPDDTPPVVLGGTAPSAVERAARMADGWAAPSALTIGGVRKRHEHVREVRGEADLDDEFTFIVPQYGFVADSKAEAWEQMKEGYLHVQRTYESWFSGEPVTELPPESVAEYKEQAIFGEPAEVVAQLQQYREALGDDIHFLFRTYHPSIGREAMRRSLERLGDEVAPELR
jgi:alkanesulfonate monooxygenase SsuD/methylene tetrahydromethanopterin reductase-like flavin-dependent oxidoreductase (luciferase family)